MDEVTFVSMQGLRLFVGGPVWLRRAASGRLACAKSLIGQSDASMPIKSLKGYSSTRLIVHRCSTGTPKISIRHADSSEVVELNKGDAMVLTNITRNNTRRKKQAAFCVTVRLAR
jgi:hypothetical protein